MDALYDALDQLASESPRTMFQVERLLPAIEQSAEAIPTALRKLLIRLREILYPIMESVGSESHLPSKKKTPI